MPTYLHRTDPCTANDVNDDRQTSDKKQPYISDGLSLGSITSS